MGIQTGDEMAAVDLTDTGDCCRLFISLSFLQNVIFRNGFQHIQKLFHGFPHFQKVSFPRSYAERGETTPFPCLCFFITDAIRYNGWMPREHPCQ